MLWVQRCNSNRSEGPIITSLRAGYNLESHRAATPCEFGGRPLFLNGPMT